MKVSFCGGKEKCCSSNAFRKKKNKTIWLANREENLKDNDEEIASVFLGENWDSYFVTIGRETQNVLIGRFAWNTFVQLCCWRVVIARLIFMQIFL